MVTQLFVVCNTYCCHPKHAPHLPAGYYKSEHVEADPNVMTNYKSLSAILLLW